MVRKLETIHMTTALHKEVITEWEETEETNIKTNFLQVCYKTAYHGNTTIID